MGSPIVKCVPTTETAGVQTSECGSSWQCVTNPLCEQCSNCQTCAEKRARIFLCEICGDQHISKWNFEQHKSKHASKSRKTVSKASREKHVADIECPFCRKFMNLRNIKVHLERNRNGCGKVVHRWKCCRCDVQFIDVDGLVEHLPCLSGDTEATVEQKEKFLDNKLILCPYCERWMTTWNLTEHLQKNKKGCSQEIHHCRCRLCGLQCDHISALVEHLWWLHSAS